MNRLHLLPGEDSEVIPVADLKKLYQYWYSKKADRKMPPRSDIKPSDLIQILPKILLIDVERNPLRFKCRLVGTEIVNAMGQDYTGKYLDEIGLSSMLEKRIQWLVEHQQAYYTVAKFDFVGRNFMGYHVLCLPLGDEQQGVKIILCGVESFYRNHVNKQEDK